MIAPGARRASAPNVLSEGPPTMRCRLPLPLLLAASLALAPVAGLAQAPDAEALIREGAALRRERRDEEALDRFQRAWELGRSPRARAQMAFAEQALGRWPRAEAHLREAREASTDPWIRDHLAVIDRSTEIVAGHLASLAVAGGVPGAEVLVDGHVEGTIPLPGPLRVAAGQVALEVRAPGYVTVRRSVQLAAGATARETVDLAPAAVEPPAAVAVVAPAPIAPPSRARVAPPIVARPPPAGVAPLRVVGIAVGAAGAVLAGVGLGLYLDVDRQYASCIERGCHEGDQPRAQDTASVALLWGGGLLAVGGAALAIFAPPRRAAAEGARVTGAWVDPRGAAGLRGAF